MMTRRQLISTIAVLTVGAGCVRARAQQQKEPKLETVTLIISGMT
jgi:hypothetical protein